MNTPTTRKLPYLLPKEAGLTSTPQRVAADIAALLNALESINSANEYGTGVDECWALRVKMIDNLRRDGWRISNGVNTWKVKAPLAKVPHLVPNGTRVTVLYGSQTGNIGTIIGYDADTHLYTVSVNNDASIFDGTYTMEYYPQEVQPV